MYTQTLSKPFSFSKVHHWLVLFGFWTIPALMVGLTLWRSMPADGASLSSILGWQLLIWYPWAVLTPLIFDTAHKKPFQRGLYRQRIVLHLSLSLLIGVLFLSYLVAAEWVLMGKSPLMLGWRALMPQVVIVMTLSGVFYWVMLAIVQGLLFMHWDRDRQALLVKARLQALTAQVHPHFLFNTLHAVATLIEEDGPTAQRMVYKLSELLRASLAVDDRQQTTLKEELELLQHYLDIEGIRFHDRLRVVQEVDPVVVDVLIPPLLLQPLVENAVRHGISQSSRAGLLEIYIAPRGEDQLLIEIKDDGPGPDSMRVSGLRGAGLGLSNTRERLSALHGEAASVRLVQRPEGGACCCVILPIHRFPTEEAP